MGANDAQQANDAFTELYPLVSEYKISPPPRQEEDEAALKRYQKVEANKFKPLYVSGGSGESGGEVSAKRFKFSAWSDAKGGSWLRL